MPDLFGAVTDTSVYAGPSAQAWFAQAAGISSPIRGANLQYLPALVR
jgi:hypothetical protein